jgi:hypothetical protein
MFWLLQADQDLLQRLAHFSNIGTQGRLWVSPSTASCQNIRVLI